MSTAQAGRASWSLQRRLVVGIVALLALISIIIGAVSVLTLRQNLLQRLDGQLMESMKRSQNFLPELESIPPNVSPGTGNAQSAGTLGLVIANGRVFGAEYLDEQAHVQRLTIRQQRILVTVDSEKPSTVQLGGRLGSYRIATTVTPEGFILLVGLPMGEVNATTGQLLLIIAAVTAIGLVVAAAVSTFVVRLALKPLSGVVATAKRVAELELDRGDVALAERVPQSDASGTTEVGQVGAALNAMLEHVAEALSARQASESKVRQFVADASHELRTPLASIRGYSELTRRGGHTLPPDIVKSLSRIESESVRMTELVEELLLLARLDEGTELRLEPVALNPLVLDLVDDARASSPDHYWIFPHPENAVTLVGDPARLHQALANILANARIHTPAGTTVTTSVVSDGSRAFISVSDDGPGIPAQLLPRLFERFVRGDGSRSRAAGSTGLGLSIAQAIIVAHGGSITVTSAPNDTRFVIAVPITTSFVTTAAPSDSAAVTPTV